MLNNAMLISDYSDVGFVIDFQNYETSILNSSLENCTKAMVRANYENISMGKVFELLKREITANSLKEFYKKLKMADSLDISIRDFYMNYMQCNSLKEVYNRLEDFSEDLPTFDEKFEKWLLENYIVVKQGNSYLVY